MDDERFVFVKPKYYNKTAIKLQISGKSGY